MTLSLTPPLLTLLHLTPLISTTASLTHAYVELITTSSFLTPAPTSSALSRSMLRGDEPTLSPNNDADLAAAKELAIPAWFINFFSRAVWSVIGFNSITLLSASANLWLFGDSLGDSRKYYVTGLVAAVAHFAFVPLVGESITRLFKMCDAHEKGQKPGREGKRRMNAVQNLEEWVWYHKIRMGTVDLVAWASFVLGTVGVLTLDMI